ncbi:MAG: hypothetical protein ABI294_00980 [Casimicrobiaceae bacterium]
MQTLIVSACALLLLCIASCATAPLTRAQVDGRIVCNKDYMDQVERNARRQMTDLRWVNCPTVQLHVVNS